jgi:hypothetical protein
MGEAAHVPTQLSPDLSAAKQAAANEHNSPTASILYRIRSPGAPEGSVNPMVEVNLQCAQKSVPLDDGTLA